MRGSLAGPIPKGRAVFGAAPCLAALPPRAAAAAARRPCGTTGARRDMLQCRCDAAQPSAGAPTAAAAAAGPATLGGLRIERLQAPSTGSGSGSEPSSPAGQLPPVPPVEEWGGDPTLMAGCEPGTKLRVAVLVSGGVDSSVALRLVAAAGHKPVAFYLQIWFQEDFRNFWDACPWEEDLGYARAVCEEAGVPLEVVPMTDQYWGRVVSHSVAEIKAGRTPNPDMLCNSRVKFGAFLEWLEQTYPGRFDRVASGHYARLDRTGGGADEPSSGADAERRSSGAECSTSGRNGDKNSSSSSSSATLCLTPDAVKDQTYFLAQLSPAQLARTMFPLGALTKPQVRALAVAAGLATSGRKDSQGICFLGKVKFGEFVKEHLGTWPGPLVDGDSGAVVGLHDGYWFYTVGQRGGIKLPGGPWYVVAKDMRLNTVTVSRAYHDPAKRRDAFAAGPVNWLGPARPAAAEGAQGGGGELRVKVRHGPNTARCRVLLGTAAEVGQWTHRFAALAGGGGESSGSSSVDSGDSSSSTSSSSSGSSLPAWEWREEDIKGPPTTPSPVAASPSGGDGDQYCLVLLDGNDQGLAPGQYAVLYQGQVCLGSAKILGAVGAPEAGEALTAAAAAHAVL